MQQTMIIHSFATSDSITLYWEKPGMLPAGGRYEVRLNGAEAAVCDRTHCTLNGLRAETSYTVQVRAFGPVQEENEAIIYAESCCLELKTEMKKDLLDVTQAPYYAAGDGKTMDTQALQKAIDDCRADQAVYLPAGVYLTGALRLHSDMELYLEEGALLQLSLIHI